MTQHSDPASNAAKNQSNESVDNPVQSCPLRADWLTIKPLRYAVADDDSEAALPDDFAISPDLPSLTQHKYMTRELVEQYVYLYHPKEHYLLEVHYQNTEVPYQADQVVGRCVFGELDQSDPEEKNVSTALANTPALLKQKKGDSVVMWLTHAPLSAARIQLLQDNPELTQSLGQRIDLAAAAKDKQASAFPLFDAKNRLGELLASQEEQMTWTALPLVKGVDEASLIGDYNDATPDNSYGVNLIDPIGITTDLCREFSVAYEMVMNSLMPAQHPFQMAKLTRAIINKEAQEARGAPFNEVAFRRIAETVHEINKPQGFYLSAAQKEKAEKQATAEFEKNYQAALADRKSTYRQDADKRYQNRKEKLEALVHVEEMDALLDDNHDGMAKIKQVLDDLAKDWLAWLKHDQLDMALSWLDDTDEKQRVLKEMLVAAMVNNINAVEDGAVLVSHWLDHLSTQLEKALGQPPVNMSGVEAHFFISLGHGATDNTKGLLYASSALKAINSAVSAIRTEVEKNYEALMGTQKITATPATEVLLETVTTHMARTSVSSQSGQLLWQQSIEVMSRRYGLQFATVNMKLEEVAWDIKASYAAITAITGNHFIRQETLSSQSTRVHSQRSVTLYDLEQAAPIGDPFTRDQSKYPRVLANHMKATEVWLSNKEGLKKVYKATNTVFSSINQAHLVGIFTFLQVYNTIKLYDAMQTDDSFKNQTAYYTALLSVSTTSLALVDKVFSKSFAGENFTDYMKKKGSIAIGEKVTISLKNSNKASLVMKMFQVSEQTQMKFYERMGKLAATFVNGAFRFVPILGGIAAVFSSGVKLHDSVGKQNALAVGLSATSLLLNGFALGALVMAFFFSGTLLMPIAVVLGMLAVAADICYAFIADDQVTLLLKSSYWGKEEYKYINGLTDLNKKAEHFADLVFVEQVPDATLKGLTFELRAFCDYLFKPMVQIIQQSKDSKGYSQFTLQIGLPHFIKGQSDFSLSVTGKDNVKGQTLLATTSTENRWQANTLKGKLSMQDTMGLVTLTIDEHQLEGYVIHKVGQASRNNKGRQGMNYHSYDMALEYHNPAGVPVSLSYPQITIDDNKVSWAFWRNNTEVEAFQAETEALEQQTQYEMDYWKDKLLSF